MSHPAWGTGVPGLLGFLWTGQLRAPQPICLEPQSAAQTSLVGQGALGAGAPRADSPLALVAHRIVPGVLGQQVSDCISKLCISELPLQQGVASQKHLSPLCDLESFRCMVLLTGACHGRSAAALATDGLLALTFSKCWSAWPYIFHQVVQLILDKAARLSGWEEAILLEAIKPYEEVVVNGLSV